MQRDKRTISIVKILLITLTTIMLISYLIIGSLIFLNWFDYAESASKDILIKLDKDIGKGLEDYIEGNWLDMDKDLNPYLEYIIADKNRIALVVDRDSGDLIGNSLKMDNFLKFQDGTKRKIHISNMGYPALSEAYQAYLETNLKLHRLKNVESKLYIHISEYNLGEYNWLLLTALPGNHLTKSIVDNIVHTVILAIIGLSIALLTYFYLIKRLLKPARMLLDSMESFTRGDLSKRTMIVRNDEIGTAARAFNNMADTIYELVNNLESKVRERTLELEAANKTTDTAIA